MHDRSPTIFTDPDGTLCVRVPLANSDEFAEAYADDYADLLRKGLTGNWQLNAPNRIGRCRIAGYVQCSAPAEIDGRRYTIVGVARIIAGAGAGKIVRYRDRNRLNLRRDNLRITRGFSRYSEGDLRLTAVNDGEAQA